jgi:transposase-like protein
MAQVKRYSPEVRDRAIRMVVDHRGEYPSQWAAIQSVANKLGMTPETLRIWVRQTEIDTGDREGITSEAKERVRQLERENAELKRANEILRAASIFFATELDGQPGTKRNK